jgi:hypothetical protein
LAVGLRCVFAHRTGLHLPLVLIAVGVHADAAARRVREHGDGLRLTLGPAGGTAAVRLLPFASQSAGNDDEFRQETAYWSDGLPDTEDLTLTVAWPEIGLPPTATALQLPGLATLARAAVVLC